MSLHKRIRQFFFPSLTPQFVIRALGVTLFAYLFFGHLCIPFRIQGYSMEPTYPHGGFNFCWKMRYLFSIPQRHDVVNVRWVGNKFMLLKRIVALENEQVEFRDGKLFVDGKNIEEPYVHYPCHWNLPPRQVEKNCVYVVGDNRSMSIEDHHFGQTSMKRILGGPLW